ncbi:Dolichyl-diphosphooligosaccharide--protein glycosyltransferase subunit 1 [Papilio xuthus]|uniref:Dolichyl-diphosphooligosaccharide--protein glycosyltransferase subunit 1 n=1 Tax=Papilio xuthus TaxID=66420 RepID=A0A194Q4I4_PAPXU|nr:Dolichyl-diphosphooligosaccharide--protein glycosyltransferase subunit 1 [Papilio xuthus]
MIPAMAKITFSLAFLLCVIIKCNGVNVDTISNEIRIKNVERHIDISSQLVKITSKITLENAGQKPVKNFLYAAESTTKNNLAFVGVKDNNNRDLRLVETTVKGYDDVKFWRVELKEPINAASTIVLTAEAVYTKSLLP